MFWDKKAECMSKDEKEKVQHERLQKTVKLAYENVEFYKKRFDEIENRLDSLAPRVAL